MMVDRAANESGSTSVRCWLPSFLNGSLLSRRNAGAVRGDATAPTAEAIAIDATSTAPATSGPTLPTLASRRVAPIRDGNPRACSRPGPELLVNPFHAAAPSWVKPFRGV